MSMIDLDAFRETPLVEQPFEYSIVPHFIPSNVVEGILEDFPQIEQGGPPFRTLTN